MPSGQPGAIALGRNDTQVPALLDVSLLDELDVVDALFTQARKQLLSTSPDACSLSAFDRRR